MPYFSSSGRDVGAQERPLGGDGGDTSDSQRW